MDLDGDGTDDVEGLPPEPPEFTMIADHGDITAAERNEFDRPLESSVLSPMGQIDYQGAVIQNALRSGGWRRRTVKIWAWVMIASFVGFFIAAIVG